MSAEYVQATYIHQYGIPYVSGMVAADLHVHVNPGADAVRNTEDILDDAARQGVDIVGLTDHDMTHHIPDAIEIARKIGIKLIPGVESTAISELMYDLKRKQWAPRHIRIWNFSGESSPPLTNAPVSELLREVNSRRRSQTGWEDVMVSIAHPELGDISMTEAEIVALIAAWGRDGANIRDKFNIEVHNGASVHVDNVSRTVRKLIGKHRLLQGLSGRVENVLPSYSSNKRAKVIFQKYQHLLGGVDAGSDSHGLHVGEVVVFHDPKVPTAQAVRNRQVAIMEQRVLRPMTLDEFTVGKYKGDRLERQRRKGENGIILFEKGRVYG